MSEGSLGTFAMCTLAWSVPIGIRLYNFYFWPLKGLTEAAPRAPLQAPAVWLAGVRGLAMKG